MKLVISCHLRSATKLNFLVGEFVSFVERVLADMIQPHKCYDNQAKLLVITRIFLQNLNCIISVIIYIKCAYTLCS